MSLLSTNTLKHSHYCGWTLGCDQFALRCVALFASPVSCCCWLVFNTVNHTDCIAVQYHWIKQAYNDQFQIESGKGMPATKVMLIQQWEYLKASQFLVSWWCLQGSQVLDFTVVLFLLYCQFLGDIILFYVFPLRTIWPWDWHWHPRCYRSVRDSENPHQEYETCWRCGFGTSKHIPIFLLNHIKLKCVFSNWHHHLDKCA